MPSSRQTARYRDSLQEEIDSAAIYETLAKAEQQPQLAEVYRRLAAAEREHARFWEEKLRAAGQPVRPCRPSWRARGLSWLARRFGPQIVLPTMMAAEQATRDEYDGLPLADAAGLSASERAHARLLREIAGTSHAGIEGGTLARLEGRHHAIGGNALRAAVLGANDGLCSNLSLVMGVAGAALSGHAILVTGLAGLLAGSSSMALGEWLSVQSSRELYQRQIEIEREELTQAPEEEAAELALIYQAKGLSEPAAQALAAKSMADQNKALDTLAREELGIDPKELGGSAWEAAFASFALFAVGASVPVLPFFFGYGRTVVLLSLAISALALFLIGAAITLLTGRSVLYTGVRQLVVGLGAAGLTYGIGRLIGAAITG